MSQIIIENPILNSPLAEPGIPVLCPSVRAYTTVGFGVGHCAFIEITDPWDAQSRIRTLLATAPDTAKGDPHAHAT